MFLQELNINGEKLVISTLKTAPNVTPLQICGLPFDIDIFILLFAFRILNIYRCCWQPVRILRFARTNGPTVYCACARVWNAEGDAEWDSHGKVCQPVPEWNGRLTAVWRRSVRSVSTTTWVITWDFPEDVAHLVVKRVYWQAIFPSYGLLTV